MVLDIIVPLSLEFIQGSKVAPVGHHTCMSGLKLPKEKVSVFQIIKLATVKILLCQVNLNRDKKQFALKPDWKNIQLQQLNSSSMTVSCHKKGSWLQAFNY